MNTQTFARAREVYMDLSDPEVFVQHCIEHHGMSEETWFNIPTTRHYHEHLHFERQQEQDHDHA